MTDPREKSGFPYIFGKTAWEYAGESPLSAGVPSDCRGLFSRMVSKFVDKGKIGML